MELTPKKLLAAAAVTGFLAVGGMSIASAQTEEPTTTTVPEESPSTVPEEGTPPADDGHAGCDRDGDGQPDQGSTDSAEETTGTPAAAAL